MRHRYFLLCITSVLLALHPVCVSSADELTLQEQARQARLDGDYQRATELARAGLAQNGEDADLWLELGLSRMAEEDYAGARTALETAHGLAPDYPDVSLALARLDYFQGNHNDALRGLELLHGMPEADALQARIRSADTSKDAGVSAAPTRWRADLSAERSKLTRDLPDWTLVTAALSFQTPAGRSGAVLVEQSERFNRQDTYFELRGGARLSRNWSGHLGLGGTPDADYRPEVKLFGGVESRPDFSGGRSGAPYVSVDASIAQYASGTVSSLMPGLHYAYANGSRLGGKLIIVSDEQGKTHFGEILDGRWQASPDVALSVSAGRAAETSDGITLNVTTIAGRAHFRLGDSTALGLSVYQETRPSYDLTGLNLALTRFF